jgi:CHAT domain-containing protein
MRIKSLGDLFIGPMKRSRRLLNFSLVLFMCSLVPGCISVSWRGNTGSSDSSTGWWLMSAKEGTRLVGAGQYRVGLEYLQKALTEVRGEGDKANEVVVLSLIADVYARLGQYRQELVYLNEALGIARKIGATGNEGVILANMGGAYFAMGDNESAAESYAAALPVLKKSGELLYTAPALFSGFANVLAAEGLYEEALELYDKALEVPILQPGEKVGILFSKGNVQFLRKDYASALKLYEQALILAQELPYPALQAGPLAGVGSVYEKEGRREEALACYERSIEAQEKVLEAAGPSQFRISLAEQPAAVYRRAIPLSLRIGQDKRAFELSERARARSFLDQVAANRVEDNRVARMQRVDSLRLKLIELKRELKQVRRGSPRQEDHEAAERIREQIASLKENLKTTLDELPGGLVILNPMASAATAGLPDIQKALDEDTTLLSYFVAEENTLAFVITHDSFRALELPVGEKQLNAAVQHLDQMSGSAARGAVAVDAGIDTSLETSLKELSSWLIAPVAQHLNTEKIGIVPHGVLNYLPFAALNDGTGYFGDSHRLFSLPSATMLAYLKPTTGFGRTALIMAQQDVEGFPRLTFATQEARAIADLYHTEPLIGSKATETAFRAWAGQANIIHLAAHGELNPVQPLFSRILLGKDSKNDGSLEVHEVYGLDLQETDLVVLSACDTQLGPLSRGDDFVGLSRAFLSAGAPAVVATLWPVDDEATGLLMTRFYSNLSSGMGRAASLSAAQKATRARYSHPYFWAGFILTGDPGGPE